MMVPTNLCLLASALLFTLAAADCPGEAPTKQLLCYLTDVPSQFDPCLCTHLVLQTQLDKLTPDSDLVVSARGLQERNPSLRLLLEVTDSAEVALKKRSALAQTIASVVAKCGLDGVQVALRWGKPTAAKVQLVDFVQTLSKEFDKLEPKDRTKRSYKIHESIVDDVVTPPWRPDTHRSSKLRKTRDTDNKEGKVEGATSSTEEGKVEDRQETLEEENEEEHPKNGKLILMHLTAEPQHLAKNFDLKRLSKYVSLYTLASDNLTDASEHGLTYHPSRLMGIEDILNADSLVDLVTGLGAPHEKLVLTLPASTLRFTLADKEKNLPLSPITGEPSKISRPELCKLMSEGEWTVERDEDLTAPYAFHDTTWLAFDDPTSVSIKGKYILLRDLAGVAVSAADSEDWANKCGSSGPTLLKTLHDTFTNIARKTRAAQLVSLQEQLHEAGHFSYSGDIHLSPYRIVRVVDRAGSIHVVRKEAKTEFECSRQGYFRHPSGCNRFYRCVKFNQYSPDFTVFEYDCPAGLAFDETVEVCVWPGSLADGGACQGSSEIAPVPRSRYVCPQVAGYYADPENCRWFFACLDHQGDGSPLTAYEFRCPFGLVFDEQALVCNWPWLVPGCGGAGVYSARFTVGDFYEGRHRPSYASLSDVHVSGGRIENVPGGVVLGSAISGIGAGAYQGSYGSGSNVLGVGSYAGGSGGAYEGVGSGYNVAGGAGLGYVAGGLASGSQQSSSVSGSGGLGYQSGVAYGGAFGSKVGAYSTGGSDGSGYKTGSAVNSGSLEGNYYSGANYGSGYKAGSYSAGSAGYDGSTGGGYYSGANSGSGYKAASYSAGSAGYDGSTGGGYSSSTKFGNAGSYSSGSYVGTAYAGADNSGAYVEDNSGAYIHDSTGDTGGLYTGKESYGGQYTGSYVGGGAYVPGLYDNGAYHGSGSSGGQYKHQYVEGGDYLGSYDTGAYLGSGSGSEKYKGQYDSGAYSGKYDAGAYAGKYDAGAYSGKYDAGAYAGKYDAGAYAGKYDSGAYSGKYDAGAYAGKYDAGSYKGASDSSDYRGGDYYSGGSVSYQGGYKVPTGVLTDGHNYNTLNTVEHKPAVGLVGLDAVKVTGGDLHSGGYISSYVTPSPLPAVSVTPIAPLVSTYSSVTPTPVPISTYRGSTVQPTTPRPLTYYPVASSPVTPVTSKPLVSYSTVKPPTFVESYHQPSYVKTVTPAPVPVNPSVYTYRQPLLKNEYSSTGLQYSTPATLDVKYSYPQPTILKTPIVPLNPIQYSTPVPLGHSVYPIKPVSYSTHAPPPAIKTSYTPTVYKTPVVPLNPVQYSTPSPVHFEYSTPAPSVSYQTPASLKPLRPITYTTPAPPVSFEYSSPKPVQPVVQFSPISYSTPAPIQVEYKTPTVLKTPVVPFNPIQYSTPSPIHFEYSSPAPNLQVNPVIYSQQSPAFSYEYRPPTPVKPAPLKPIAYAGPEYLPPVQPVQPLRPITYTTPAPEVSYSYSAPTVKPVVPAVLKTPVVPLNPIQYTTPTPAVFEYSTPAPVPVKPLKQFTYRPPASEVHYEYHPPASVQPLRPISYTTPSPASSYQYIPPAPVQPVKPLKPITYTTPAPAVSYEYSAPVAKPVIPSVLKTPVVPLNPIQYTTPAPVYFEYSTPAPVPVRPQRPISYSTPAPAINYENHPPAPVQPLRPLKPISYTTPAPAISYEYSAPEVKPIVPTVLKTPVVPLNPIQYTTPAPVQFEYSTPAPVPLRPLRPFSYSTPAPEINYEYHPQAPVKPLRPITYTTPSPAISYEYSAPVFKPVIPSVLKTPVVPLNTIQYTTSAPIQFEYSTPAPLKPLRPTSYSTPAPVINFEYHPPTPVKPLKPLRPITYTTPAPDVSFEYLPPAPVQPLKPFKPITYTTPAPVVSYEYSAPVVPSVLKTPVVPLNPIQYTTPGPVQFEYSTPAPAPVRSFKPISYTTPVPEVSYEYVPHEPLKPLKPISISSPAPFSYGFKYQPVKQVPTVLKTPIVPLNPVQYTTSAPTIFEYSTPLSQTTVKPLRPVTYTTPVPLVNYEYSSTPASVSPVTFKSSSYVRPIPTVLKAPAVPLNPIQYSTSAPIVNQYRFGAAYENSELHYQPAVHYNEPSFVKTQVVEEGYNYPRPTVKFVETPKIVSTTPVPTVTYSEPSEPVTPIYKQVYDYIKTPVVSAYDKVLNAISYSTTPAPLPVQHVTQSPVSYAPVNIGPSYKRPALVKTPSIPLTPVNVVPEYQKVLNVVKATTTPAPLYVNHYTSTYEPELVRVSTPRPVIYKQKPAVISQTAYVKDYSYEENVEDLYDAIKSDFGTRLAGGYEGGYVYNQQEVEVPQVKVYTSTTSAPVTVVKETYKLRKPVKTYTYQQPAVAVGYGPESYEGGSIYSSTSKPVESSEATFGEQYHKETSFTGYTGHEGDSVSYEEIAQPIPVFTSTTQQPTVKITTSRVSLPVAPGGGYYVRKQKVRVRPVVTTENYPDVYSSTYTPSTVSTTTFAPTYSYSTTPAPAVTFSTTGHPDDEVDVEGEEEEEDGVKLLEGYNGQFGGVVKGGYSASSTVASIEDGEAIVGVLKKGKITYDGRRTKTKVVVVSKLSDFNPLLVGKLGAECSCNGNSNSLTIRKSKQRGSGRLFVPSKDSTIPDQQFVDTYLTSTSTVAPFVVNEQSSAYESSSSYESSSYDAPVVEIRPLRKKTRVYSTTTASPIYAEDNLVSEGPTFLPTGGDRVKADSVECKRAGLFRHPNKCNKFYSCNWDQWKKKFTLHEFKCPIHLAYDANLGACNWPSKGPACAEDSLLV